MEKDDYEELWYNIHKYNRQEDRVALYDWFLDYAIEQWDGEAFKCEGGSRLFPIQKYNKKYKCYDTVDAVLKG